MSLWQDMRKYKPEELIKPGVILHGHLGPYLIAGIKAGNMAVKMLNTPGNKELLALVHTGNIPPRSCFVDGIQISTGCSAGKGNLCITGDNKTSVTFIHKPLGKTITITLKEEIENLFSEWTEKSSVEDAAYKLLDLSNEEIFEIKHG